MAKKKDIKTVTEVPFADKLAKTLHDNRTAIVGLLVVGCILGLSIVGYGYMQKQKEMKVESELYTLRSQIENKINNIDFTAKTDPNKLPEKPSFEEIKGLTDQFEQAILKHDSSSSAATSALDLGGIYSEYKKFDMAKNILEKVKPKSAVLSSLVSQQLATVLFELKDFKGAISSLDKITKSKDQAFLHPDALLKKGLAYYKLGDMEKAKASFEQVAEEYTDKSTGQTAEKYLRVLKFKSLTPNKQ